MGAKRLTTYLEGVPLVVELWKRDIYNRDEMVGKATLDVSRVLSASLQKLAISDEDQQSLPSTSQAGVRSVELEGSVVGETTGSRVAEMKVVVSVEDLGEVGGGEGNEVLEAAQAQRSGSPFAERVLMGDWTKGAYPSLSNSSAFVRRGGDEALLGEGVVDGSASPTFSKMYASNVAAREGGEGLGGMAGVGRGRSPGGYSEASTNIRQTDEYKAAMEMEVWQAAEMKKFKEHLRRIEEDLLDKLTKEFAARDAERTLNLEKRLKEVEEIEVANTKLAVQLEEREVAIKVLEDSLSRKKDDLEREASRRHDEFQDVSRRLAEEFKAKSDMDQLKLDELKEMKNRAVKEREEIEGKYKSLESQFEEFRRNVMDGKVSGLGVTPHEVGEKAVAAIRKELASVVASSAATERKMEKLESAKKEYKEKL
jgi:hypothetical protein